MKKGLFGFMAGAGLGGLVALLSAKRKGKDVRADLMKSWKEGKAGGGVLKDELTNVAKEAKAGMEELYNTSEVQKIAEEAKGKLSQAKQQIEEGYGKVMDKAKHAADSIVEGIKGGTETAAEDVKDAVKSAKKTTSSVKKTVTKK